MRVREIYAMGVYNWLATIEEKMNLQNIIKPEKLLELKSIEMK